MNLTFDLNSAAERNTVRQLLDALDPNRQRFLPASGGSGTIAPAKTKTKTRRAKAPKPKANGNGKTHADDVVLTVLKRKKTANWSKDILPALEKAGLTASGSAMTKLLREKEIRRSGRGVYQLAA